MRFVQHEQLRLVQERPAESEALCEAPGESAHPLVPGIPQAETLEDHADALASLGDAVQAAEQVEVLERGQIAVDERLVTEEPDPPAIERHFEGATCRCRESDEKPQEGRLPGAVRAGDDERASLERGRTRSRGARSSSRTASRASPHE